MTRRGMMTNQKTEKQTDVETRIVALEKQLKYQAAKIATLEKQLSKEEYLQKELSQKNEQIKVLHQQLRELHTLMVMQTKKEPKPHEEPGIVSSFLLKFGL